MDWKETFEAEIQAAQQARLTGYEGRARVCARRAAGIVLREYLRRKGTVIQGLNALEIIRACREEPQIPQTVREILAHLLVQVQPGGELPIQNDLVAEAYRLPEELSLDR